MPSLSIPTLIALWTEWVYGKGPDGLNPCDVVDFPEYVGFYYPQFGEWLESEPWNVE